MSRQDIQAAADKLEDSTGVEVSGQAKNIIFYVVSAVETDPHPAWRQWPGKSQFLESLPEYLSSVVEEERVKRKVTTFDVLHWLSRHLEGICPIEKERW